MLNSRIGCTVILVSIFALASLGFKVTKVEAEEINLIQNPSLETAGVGGVPLNWTKQYWGSPVPTFKYPDIGKSDTDKGASITFTKVSTGDARWSHNVVNVVAGESYTYSNWYKSNIGTEINAEFTDSSGKKTYTFVATVPSSNNTWKQITATIKIPSGVTKAVIYHLINKKGTLNVDDFSLVKVGTIVPPPPPPPPPLPTPTLTLSASPESITVGSSSTISWTSTNTTSCTASNGWSGSKNISGNENVSPQNTTTYTLSCSGTGGNISKQVTITVNVPPPPPPPLPPIWDGMVTISFDDSWISQYTVALPVLETAGIKGTFYITTEPLIEHWDDFMTPNQVKTIAQKGHEIGGHTVTHPHLPELSETSINYEIINSKNYLENLVGTKVTALAYPYGEFNTTIKNLTKDAGYTTARGVDEETLNTATTDKYDLKSSCIEKSTPFSVIKQAIDNAKSKKQWYILCIHEIKTDGDEYSMTPTQFQQIVDYIKSAGIKTVTVKEGSSLLSN